MALPQPRRFGWLDRLPQPLVGAGAGALDRRRDRGGRTGAGNRRPRSPAWRWSPCPPLAALALGWLVRGGRPAWALAVAPLFALAWASPGSLAGEAAATALTALACVTLGWLLVSVAPAAWLRLGIYAMAAVDTWFVAAELLQGPNAVLTAAAPGGPAAPAGDPLRLRPDGLRRPLRRRHPRLPAGRLERPRQLRAAVLVAVLALAFDLLFFALDTLPATVPVAVALAIVDLSDRVARRKGTARPAG